jgi:membrane associated rhomboid family serine protease
VAEFELPGALAILAVTVATSLLGLYRMPRIVDRLVMRPWQVARGRRVETVVTSGFVHGDMGHLLFNMVTFFFFAFPMERHLGTPAFVTLYATGLLTSSACTVFKHRHDRGYATLGASGAISAVLFAFIVYFPTTQLLIFPIPVPVPAALFAVGYVAYSWWAGKQQRGGINHDAHLCGAISGLAFVGITDPGAFAGLAATLG